MSRLKAAAIMLAWWLAFATLYALEAHGYPEIRHWHIFDWRLWLLIIVNSLAISGTVDQWKSLRSGR